MRNFRERRWEPAELNGGKLAEVVYCILKGHVENAFSSAPAKPSNMVDACRALEKASGFPRSVRVQIPRILLALYEIRNNRNVGHVGADVDPNHMDATVVVALSQWVMAELVRIFHDVSTDEASLIVDSLTERTIPLLWEIGGRTRVLQPGMSARDKTLVLLYGSLSPLGLRYITDSIEYANVTQFKQKVLAPAHKAALIDFEAKSNIVALSPLGARYVEENITLAA
jgi:hypothetical protein